MLSSDMIIRAQRSFSNFGLDLYLFRSDERGNGYSHYASSVEMKPLDQGVRIDPTFNIDNHAAQRLIDELWEQGYRPSERLMPTANTLEAQKYHLEDMRKIAFDVLSKKG